MFKNVEWHANLQKDFVLFALNGILNVSLGFLWHKESWFFFWMPNNKGWKEKSASSVNHFHFYGRLKKLFSHQNELLESECLSISDFSFLPSCQTEEVQEWHLVEQLREGDTLYFRLGAVTLRWQWNGASWIRFQICMEKKMAETKSKPQLRSEYGGPSHLTVFFSIIDSNGLK